MWFVYALLSALFAALTAILAKVGLDGINSTLATAIRTAVVLVMAWGMVFLQEHSRGYRTFRKKAGYFWFFPALPPAHHGSFTLRLSSWAMHPR